MVSLLAGDCRGNVGGEFREVFEAHCDDGVYDAPVDGMITKRLPAHPFLAAMA